MTFGHPPTPQKPDKKHSDLFETSTASLPSQKWQPAWHTTRGTARRRHFWCVPHSPLSFPRNHLSWHAQVLLVVSRGWIHSMQNHAKHTPPSTHSTPRSCESLSMVSSLPPHPPHQRRHCFGVNSLDMSLAPGICCHCHLGRNHCHSTAHMLQD